MTIDAERLAEALYEQRRAKYKAANDWSQIDDDARDDWRDTASLAIREYHAVDAPRLRRVLEAGVSKPLTYADRHELVLTLIDASTIHFELGHTATAELIQRAAANIFRVVPV